MKMLRILEDLILGNVWIQLLVLYNNENLFFIFYIYNNY